MSADLNPTPWAPVCRAGCVFIDDANGAHIVTFYGNDRLAERQAERICGAVNSNAELLVALREIKKNAEDLANDLHSVGCGLIAKRARTAIDHTTHP